MGTKGTIKSLTSRQLDRPELAPEIILSNTYHLALQPGTDLLADLGGAPALSSFGPKPLSLSLSSCGALRAYARRLQRPDTS